MRWRSLIWATAGLILLSAVFWYLKWRVPSYPSGPLSTNGAVVGNPGQPGPAVDRTSTSQGGLLPVPLGRAQTESQPADAFAEARAAHLQYRLSNTSLSVGELARRDAAILLANALIDTSGSSAGPTSADVGLHIPEHLRAQGDPGSYIVQSRGPISDRFRQLIAQAGGSVVSYIPNNAYLVRLTAAAANQLAANPQTQVVLPFEPYYKFSPDLLKIAADRQPMPPNSGLNLTLFADAREATLEALKQLGAYVFGEERSPFGPVVTVQVPRNKLPDLARLPGVQGIELFHSRISANDLSRVRLGVAADTVVETNYLGLTGANVLVNVNDTGVDAGHPDLAPRVTGDSAASLVDTSGHGTHVAGIIASSGAHGPPGTNVSGSVDGANFRGKAPAARIFSMLQSRPDSYLQETAARTNAFISNNGWLYSVGDYNIAAASFDAAVRDALPGVTGAQPLLFVFPAGNSGAGNESGLTGEPGSILSPGTAKNVITVGALEQPRFITNEVVIRTGTNQMFLRRTDSEDEVAGFSSRGNVGIGIEGDFGRFKPDLVAPGVFVVSTRSRQWDEATYYNPTNRHVNTFRNQIVEPGELNQYSIFVWDNAVQLNIYVTPNSNSPVPFPDMPIYVKQTGVPTSEPGGYDFLGTNSVSIPPALALVTGVGWHYAIGNSTTQAVSYNVTTEIVTTNDMGNYFEVLSNLNNTLGPFYRFESGSSMAAASVSGMLALMQEFFEQRSQLTNPVIGRAVSPALLKALLINGARSAGTLYDMQVRNIINYQGWGVPSLPAALPEALAGPPPKSGTAAPIWVFDQNPTNALATGQSQTWRLKMDLGALSEPLRVTLVWTDPPGNPAAGIKLVNDLDLVVTNLDTGEVFFGNDIPAGSDFNQAWDTINPPNLDQVNNVENVFLAPVLATNYTVTVIARRVNVNAVTANTNNVVQDYALVISCGDGAVSNAITLTPEAFVTDISPNVTYVAGSARSNAVPLLNQHVGANFQLLGTNTISVGSGSPWAASGVITLGVTNQWTFYALTNVHGYTNAAFVTFMPPTLSVPRIGTRQIEAENATRIEADIDLYVSRDPALTNLDPAAVSAARKSLGRGGTEAIVYTNAERGVYYVGVKSEDQQAAEYGFLGVFSESPFAENNSNGVTMRALTAPVAILDGSPDKPSAALVFAVNPWPITLRRVIVTNYVTHQNFGDLLGNLSHGQKWAVLNNHTFGTGFTNQVLIYEDNGEVTYFANDNVSLQHTDGPGSLRDFIGEDGTGLWMLTMVDNALFHTGQVDNLDILLEPEIPTNGIVTTIEPNSAFLDSIDVPAEATNLTVSVAFISGTGPLTISVRRGTVPTDNLYDKKADVLPPGGSLSVTPFDFPPLQAGRYFIRVANNTGSPQTVRITKRVDLDPGGAVRTPFASAGPIPLLDDAVTNASIFVSNDQRIASVDVAVQIQHPRVSDLALTVVSPRGTRVLLWENRGGATADGLGSSLVVTNVYPETRSGDFNANTNVLATGQFSGTVIVDYEFYTIPDRMRVYYEGSVIYDTGWVSGSGRVSVDYGPGSSTDVTIIMNEENNSNPDTRWDYTATAITRAGGYVVFTENTNLTATPIKFAAPPFGGAGAVTNVLFNGFEGAGQGDYPAGSTLDIWTVLTNQVSVVNDPVTANEGNQFLALADGAVSTVLPTETGKRYAVTFAYRGPGAVAMWRGEGNSIDSVGTNHGVLVGGATTGVGLVGSAFDLDGAAGYVEVPDSDLWAFGTNDFTIELWANFRSVREGSTKEHPAVVFISNNEGAGSFNKWWFALGEGKLWFHINSSEPTPGSLFLVGAPFVPAPNEWYHLAVTRKGDVFTIYRDGVAIGSEVNGAVIPNPNATLTIGQSENDPRYFMNGLLDEVSIYNRALSPSEIRAIYAAGSAGKFDPAAPLPSALAKANLTLGAVVRPDFYGNNTDWQTYSYSFTAMQTNTPLVITGLEPGMLLDSFSLAVLPEDLYFFGEQSLRAFLGENALGEWRLEIWDNRAGAPAPGGTLLSWQLRFVFERPVIAAIGLTNHIPYSGTVETNWIQYFYVDVPVWANFATNTLVIADGPVDVLFNQSALPTGTRPGDYLMLSGVTSGSFTLANYTVPPLVPGQRYYLGVANRGAAPVNFTIRVDFDTTFPVVACFPPAFPGAEGAGACAIGGRGGSVYYVTNLDDSGPGSLRDAVSGPNRTIVFAVSGTIDLLSDLEITNSFLTIAGQTAPGDGITIRGGTVSVKDARDVIIRFIRFRAGDINCPVFQGDSFNFVQASNCIADHVSASWSVDETLSVTHSTNVTVQWSLITESLNNSCNSKGPHGYGSLLRYGYGNLSFHHNLYAHHNSRNPRLGDNISLDFVNNVIYNWGSRAGYSGDDATDIVDNPDGFTNRLNYAGNYLIAGTNTLTPDIAFHGGTLNTWIFQADNLIDTNLNGVLDGTNTGWGMFDGLFTPVAGRFNHLPQVSMHSPEVAWARVLSFSGAAAVRDAVDLRVVNSVRAQNGRIIDSQSEVGGWPLLNSTTPPLDTDLDGMPDYWEITLGLDPLVAGNNGDRNLDGYTDLEEYINWLAAPHALTAMDTPVDVDLKALAGNTGNLTFSVENGTNGVVSLLPDGRTAHFTPNTGVTAFASFRFNVTDVDTGIAFGPVVVSVFVATNGAGVPAASIITLTNAIPYFNTNAGTGNLFDFYRFVVSPGAARAEFEILGPSGNVELVVRRGLPLPDLVNCHYLSTNPGTADELIVVQTNSAPVVLSPGEWYLAAINLSGGPASYAIKATEFASPSAPSTNVQIVAWHFAGDSFCITWNSTVGTRYIVQGKPDLNAPGWDVVSPSILATNAQTTWCMPLPSPYHFFRVLIDTGGGAVPPLPTISSSSASATELCLTWNSIPGMYYFVEGKPDLGATNWTMVSPSILAVAFKTTWCVPLPSPYHFFRVAWDSTGGAATLPFALRSISVDTNGVTLEWIAPTNYLFQVQWTDAIGPTPVWNVFPAAVSSATGLFTFTDTNAPVGNPGAQRYYRLRKL